jgi:hypothetical protein
VLDERSSGLSGGSAPPPELRRHEKRESAISLVMTWFTDESQSQMTGWNTTRRTLRSGLIRVQKVVPGAGCLYLDNMQKILHVSSESVEPHPFGPMSSLVEAGSPDRRAVKEWRMPDRRAY